jgi:hypothetical protein
MSPKFDDLQKMGKDQMQAATNAANSVATGLQTIATEAGEYSKKVFENSSSFFEKILGAKSIESAVQIQTEYARSAFEGFVAQTTKVGEIYGSMTKEALRPVETVMAKFQTAA